MTLLILGLVLFVGGHAVNLAFPEWRRQQIDRLGLLPWKGLYSLVAGAGLACLIIGYGDARAEGIYLYHPPLWTRHLASLLTVPAFLLLFASQIPGNRIQVAVGHPMYLGIKLWAFAHLIANGGLHDVLLFGVFLIWGIAGFAISRRRDKALSEVRAYKGVLRDVATVVVSLGAWVGFAFWGHTLLIGLPPLG